MNKYIANNKFVSKNNNILFHDYLNMVDFLEVTGKSLIVFSLVIQIIYIYIVIYQH